MGIENLPENCPICGQKMEKGTLRAKGRGVGIWWGPPNWGRRGRGGEPLWGGLVKADLVGARCANCKVLLLRYGETETKESRKS